MGQRNITLEQKRIDTKEFTIPETVFARDIDNNVFNGIILQCLSRIQGIALVEGNFLNNILGRSEGVKGLFTEQDLKNHSIKTKIEVNIAYGIQIPEKAEEIQIKIAEELTKFTGLHVAEVHVVFKGLIPLESDKHSSQLETPTPPRQVTAGEEYSDIF